MRALALALHTRDTMTKELNIDAEALAASAYAGK